MNTSLEDKHLQKSKLKNELWKQKLDHQYDPVTGLFSTYERNDAWQYKKENYLAEKLQKKLDSLKELDDIRENNERRRQEALRLEQQRKERLHNQGKNKELKEFASIRDSLEVATTITDILKLKSKLGPRLTLSQQSIRHKTSNNSNKGKTSKKKKKHLLIKHKINFQSKSKRKPGQLLTRNKQRPSTDTSIRPKRAQSSQSFIKKNISHIYAKNGTTNTRKVKSAAPSYRHSYDHIYTIKEGRESSSSHHQKNTSAVGKSTLSSSHTAMPPSSSHSTHSTTEHVHRSSSHQSHVTSSSTPNSLKPSPPPAYMKPTSTSTHTATTNTNVTSIKPHSHSPHKYVPTDANNHSKSNQSPSNYAPSSSSQSTTTTTKAGGVPSYMRAKVTPQADDTPIKDDKKTHSTTKSASHTNAKSSDHNTLEIPSYLKPTSSYTHTHEPDTSRSNASNTSNTTVKKKSEQVTKAVSSSTSSSLVRVSKDSLPSFMKPKATTKSTPISTTTSHSNSQNTDGVKKKKEAPSSNHHKTTNTKLTSSPDTTTLSKPSAMSLEEKLKQINDLVKTDAPATSKPKSKQDVKTTYGNKEIKQDIKKSSQSDTELGELSNEEAKFLIENNKKRLQTLMNKVINVNHINVVTNAAMKMATYLSPRSQASSQSSVSSPQSSSVQENKQHMKHTLDSHHKAYKEEEEDNYYEDDHEPLEDEQEVKEDGEDGGDKSSNNAYEDDYEDDDDVEEDQQNNLTHDLNSLHHHHQHRKKSLEQNHPPSPDITKKATTFLTADTDDHDTASHGHMSSDNQYLDNMSVTTGYHSPSSITIAQYPILTQRLLTEHELDKLPDNTTFDDFFVVDTANASHARGEGDDDYRSTYSSISSNKSFNMDKSITDITPTAESGSRPSIDNHVHENTVINSQRIQAILTSSGGDNSDTKDEEEDGYDDDFHEHDGDGDDEHDDRKNDSHTDNHISHNNNDKNTKINVVHTTDNSTDSSKQITEGTSSSSKMMNMISSISSKMLLSSPRSNPPIITTQTDSKKKTTTNKIETMTSSSSSSLPPKGESSSVRKDSKKTNTKNTTTTTTSKTSNVSTNMNNSATHNSSSQKKESTPPSSTKQTLLSTSQQQQNKKGSSGYFPSIKQPSSSTTTAILASASSSIKKDSKSTLLNPQSQRNNFNSSDDSSLPQVVSQHTDKVSKSRPISRQGSSHRLQVDRTNNTIKLPSSDDHLSQNSDKNTSTTNMKHISVVTTSEDTNIKVGTYHDNDNAYSGGSTEDEDDHNHLDESYEHDFEEDDDDNIDDVEGERQHDKSQIVTDRSNHRAVSNSSKESHIKTYDIDNNDNIHVNDNVMKRESNTGHTYTTTTTSDMTVITSSSIPETDSTGSSRISNSHTTPSENYMNDKLTSSENNLKSDLNTSYFPSISSNNMDTTITNTATISMNSTKDKKTRLRNKSGKERPVHDLY